MHSRAKLPSLQHPDMNAPAEITPALVDAHGLKPDEYQRILKLIGRLSPLRFVTAW